MGPVRFITSTVESNIPFRVKSLTVMFEKVSGKEQFPRTILDVVKETQGRFWLYSRETRFI